MSLEIIMLKLLVCFGAIMFATCRNPFLSALEPKFEEKRLDELRAKFGLMHKLFASSNFLNQVAGKSIQQIVIIKEEKIQVGSKYDKCLDLVEAANHNIVEMARLCLNGQWRDTIPIFVDTADKLANATACFIDAQKLAGKGIDPQCIIDHQNQAAAQFNQVIHDILHHDWNAAAADFQKVIDTLNDIQNC